MLEYLATVDDSLEFQMNSCVSKPEIWAEFHTGISNLYNDLSLVHEITHAELRIKLYPSLLPFQPSFLDKRYWAHSMVNTMETMMYKAGIISALTESTLMWRHAIK